MFLSQSKNFRFFLLAVVLIIVTLAFLPCLKNGFVNWDDDVHLTNNLQVRSLSLDNVRAIFKQQVNNLYIPLTTLSFAVEYRFFGYNPFVYHLDNLLLHLMVVIFVWIFFRQCGLSPWAAALAALLFGIHPTRVESVAWITERKDVLFALFYMLALNAYCRYLTGKDRIVYLVTIFLAFLSMLAKPMALSLPLAFLCCDWLFRRRLSYRIFIEKIPHVLVMVPPAWMVYTIHRAYASVDDPFRPFLIWAWTIVFHLKKFIFPVVLTPMYEPPAPVVITKLYYALPLLILLLLFAGVFYFRKHRLLVFAFAFYFVSVFFMFRPDLNIDVNFAADRFLYLSCLGLCMLFGVFVEYAFGRWGKRIIPKGFLVLFFTLIFAVLFLKAFSQCEVWKNSITLWNNQLRYYPNTARALNNLATAYENIDAYKKALAKYKIIQREALSKQEIARDFKKITDDIDEIKRVILLYKKAINISPEFTDPIYNLGKVYQDLGRNYEAAVLYRKTLEIDPHYKDSLFCLATIYRDVGSPTEAIETFKKTINAEPDNEDVYLSVIKAYTEAVKKNESSASVEAYGKARDEALILYERLIARKPPLALSYFNLGSLYADVGDYTKAIVYYQKALAINPEYTKTLYNLANAYAETGRLQEAVAAYKKVLTLSPKHADAYLGLGVSYSDLKDYAQAVAAYKRAVEIKPDFANAYFDLGSTYEAMGKINEAMDAYKKAIAADPEHAPSYYNLGNVYAVLKNNKEAIDSYKKAIEINPAQGDAFINLIVLCLQDGDFKQAGEYADKAKAAGVEIPGEYLKTLEAYRVQAGGN